MKCSRFARILADYQQQTLLPEEQVDADAHLEGCPSCRKLLGIARGEADVLPEAGREDLIRSILSRTSGTRCPRVGASMWDYIGDGLGTDDSQLIALHLDHCGSCREMAEACAEIRGILPAMAEIEPDGSFTRDVLRVTSQSVISESLSVGNPASGFVGRLRILWDSLVRRPHFSFEAAYVGTLCLLLLFGPSLPMRRITFDKIHPATVRPSTYLLSAWANPQFPISDRLCRYASALALKDQALSESLSRLAAKCEFSSGLKLNRGVLRIREWRRKKASALFAFWIRFDAGFRSPEVERYRTF
jgi:hypothetical protein